MLQKYKNLFEWIQDVEQIQKAQQWDPLLSSRFKTLLLKIKNSLEKNREKDKEFGKCFEQVYKILQSAVEKFEIPPSRLNQIKEVYFKNDEDSQTNSAQRGDDQNEQLLQRVSEGQSHLNSNQDINSAQRGDDQNEKFLQRVSEGQSHLNSNQDINSAQRDDDWNEKFLQRVSEGLPLRRSWHLRRSSIIKREQMKQLHKIITDVLNNGGGYIFIVNKFANEQILSGFEPEEIQNLKRQYLKIKNMKQIKIQLEKKFKIAQIVLQLRKNKQPVLMLSLFPNQKEMFNQKGMFYCQNSEIITVSPHSLQKQKQFFFNISPSFILSNFELQSLNIFPLHQHLHNQLDSVSEYLDKHRLWVFVPSNQQAFYRLENELKENIENDYKLLRAREFIGEAIENLPKQPKQLYFLFQKFAKDSINSISKRLLNEGSKFQQIQTQIITNKDVTKQFEQQFQNMVESLIKCQIVQKQWTIMKNKSIQKKVNCMGQTSSKNKFKAMATYTFMHFHSLEPILKKEGEK